MMINDTHGVDTLLIKIITINEPFAMELSERSPARARTANRGVALENDLNREDYAIL